jgi:hypothetical protein
VLFRSESAAAGDFEAEDPLEATLCAFSSATAGAACGAVGADDRGDAVVTAPRATVARQFRAARGHALRPDISAVPRRRRSRMLGTSSALTVDRVAHAADTANAAATPIVPAAGPTMA